MTAPATVVHVNAGPGRSLASMCEFGCAARLLAEGLDVFNAWRVGSALCGGRACGL